MPKPHEGEEEEEEDDEEGASDRPVHLASGYSGAGASSSGIRSFARSLVPPRSGDDRGGLEVGSHVHTRARARARGRSSMQIHRRRPDLEVVTAEEKARTSGERTIINEREGSRERGRKSEKRERASCVGC